MITPLPNERLIGGTIGPRFLPVKQRPGAGWRPGGGRETGEHHSRQPLALAVAVQGATLHLDCSLQQRNLREYAAG
jgi:hypothetical protein